MKYEKKHSNIRSIEKEIQNISDQLLKKGYVEIEREELKKENDSVFLSRFILGKKINKIYVDTNIYSELLNLKSTEIIPIELIEEFLNNCLGTLEKKGHSLAKAQLINFENKNQNLHAKLILKLEKKRTLDDIIISGYEKFPTSHLINLKRLYRKRTFNQDILKRISSDFEKFRFIQQTKSPEILFTKDSTKVFIYLQKSKPNTFDGYIGFNNNESNKLVLNGYLDLKLQNILNSGEKFNLYWKNNGSQQTSFDASIEIPYIFKSRLGIKAQLQIFKQDSTFQNAKTNLDLGYFLNYNTRLYIGYQNTESSDIQNTNSNSITDFTTSYYTSQLEYLKLNNDDILFPEKTNINIKTGIGNRLTTQERSNQYFINIDMNHNFYLNNKNLINLKSQNFYLKSNKYIVNELYRFGGINSIRGFNENSLQANLLTSLLTEYRYKFNNAFYIHSITDYGFFTDENTTTSSSLTSIGFGFGILSKNRIFNFIYANGNSKNEPIKLSSSIVHISLKIIF